MQRLVVCVVTLLAASSLAHGDTKRDELAAREQKVISLVKQSKWPEALVEARATLKLGKAILGSKHIRVATHHTNLAEIAVRLDKHKLAIAHFGSALAIHIHAHGESHADVALTLLSLGQAESRLGKSASAAKRYERALAIFTKLYGPKDAYVARTLILLGHLRSAMKQPRKALEHLSRALPIAEKFAGADNPQVAGLLTDIAGQHAALGHPRKAIPLVTRSLTILTRAFGKEHPHTLDTLAQLAWYQQSANEHSAALASYRILLARQKNLALPPTDDQVATTTINIAHVLRKLGKLVEATTHARAGLVLMEKAHGSKHPSVATALDNLASILIARGEYREAREALERSVPMWQALRGDDHVDTAVAMNSLATLLKQMGDLASALPLARRVADTFAKVDGANGERTAVAMDNLASILADLGHFDRAEAMYRKALAIHKKRNGSDHPTVATSANNIGWLLRMVNRPAEAIPFFERALRINTKSSGANHPSTAINHGQLGLAYLAIGKVKKARSHLRRALAINKKALGKSHPSLAYIMSSLAELEASTGKLGKARKLSKAALAVVERHLEPLLYATSQRERLELVGRHRRGVHLYLSLFDRPRDALAAYNRVLRWKAIVLTTMVVQRQSLLARANKPVADKLSELARVRTELANLAMAIPKPSERKRIASQIQELTGRKDRLERELSRSSAAFSVGQRMLTAGYREVCAALARDAALVDYYRYVRTDGSGPAKWHMAAFVTTGGKCKQPARVELGPAAAIDDAIRAFRKAVDDQDETSELRKAGLEVRRAAWDKLVSALDGRRNVWISTDGSLSGVPLGGLPLGTKRYLIEDYAFSYIASGKNVLQKPGAKKSAKKKSNARRLSLVIGGVNYEGPKRSTSKRTRAADGGCGIQSRPQYDFLPGTKTEAKAVASLAAKKHKVTVLYGDRADEKTIKRLLPTQNIVHLATHGFFARPCADAKTPDVATDAAIASPLVRSGIVVAGSNATRGKLVVNGEDGVLTAEEVAELDLRAVDLAVLSACETGLGDIRSGEGVMGLRWAFAIAGARALVMSLWKVPDEETRELMEAFYGQLDKRPGANKAQALRAAKLKMLRTRRSEGDALPWSWAAFIVSGR